MGASAAFHCSATRHRPDLPDLPDLNANSEDYIMSITLKRSLAGLTLVAALAVAGCGGSSSSSQPAKTHHHVAAHTSSGNKIPQNNGGDHDADNNGAPSDGDGNL
jgi:hypothetical protein